MLLLLSIPFYGQTLKSKVTVEELKETRHPKDTSAAAAILHKHGSVEIKPDQDGNWISVTEVDVRIKIYKKSGYDYANVEKAYYAGAKGDKFKFSDVNTYNLVNGEIEKTKLKSESEFTEQKSKNWKSKKISLTNVKEGSIIEYRYTVTSYGVASLETFYFQHDIPVNFVTYRVESPEYFNFKKTIGGFLRPVQEEVKVMVTGGGYNIDKTKFTLWDVPAMKDEEFVDNIDNYRSRMIYELNYYRSPQHFENFATNWEAVAKKIHESEDFGKQLDKSDYFEADLAPVLAAAKSEEERLNGVFNFVQQRMNWNEYNGYSCDDGVRTAYKNMTGNCAEINLMLIAMLRHANFQADPVLVSTRSNGIALFPSRTAFNYVVAAVKTPAGTVLLDATSKNSQPNVLPIRAINWTGRIIRKDGSSEPIELIPNKNSRKIGIVSASLGADGKVSGTLKHQYSDHNAYVFRERYGGLSTDSYIEKMEKRYSGILLDEYVLENAKSLEKPVSESYKFTHDNLVEVLGDKMYFSPMLFLLDSENPFKQEIRQYPVDFVFPHQEKYSFNINIPEGYVIESMPAPASLAMPSNIGTFKFLISGSGRQIQLSVQSDMNAAVIPAEDYDTLKEFYKEMIAKQTEKIVLKKA